MQKRKFDELVSYFNKKVSEMEIETKYKMELLGMVTALGCAYEKEMSDLSETKRDSSDTISRQAAIDALKRAEALTKAFGYHNVIDTIRELPSAEPRKGKWVRNIHDKIICNQCGMFGNNEWNFCPNCGADMRGEEDVYYD